MKKLDVLKNKLSKNEIQIPNPQPGSLTKITKHLHSCDSCNNQGGCDQKSETSTENMALVSPLRIL